MNQSVDFVEALHCKATQMGWNQGSKQITSFTNRDGRMVDIIKQYGQIDEAMLKTQCERFCKAGGADAQSRAKQNNTMMLCACLSKTLTASAQAKLLACRSEFTFNGIKYAPLMYKIINHHAAHHHGFGCHQPIFAQKPASTSNICGNCSG